MTIPDEIVESILVRWFGKDVAISYIRKHIPEMCAAIAPSLPDLTADAPEIAAAEARGRAEGIVAEATRWRDYAAAEHVEARGYNPMMAIAFGSVRKAIDARIAALTAQEPK